MVPFFRFMYDHVVFEVSLVKNMDFVHKIEYFVALSPPFSDG